MAAGQALDVTLPAPGGPPPPITGDAATGDAALAVLLACLHQDALLLRGELLTTLDEDGWQRLLSLAAAHSVRGLVNQRLTDSSVVSLVPANVQRDLRDAARQTAARMLRAQTQIAELVSGFDTASIPVIALKGVHLARAVYPNQTLRAMQDIDLLVPREDLQSATDIALGLGYTPIRPFTVDQEAAAKSHIARLTRPESLDVEIHWNITAPNVPYSIDPADLWARTVPVDVGRCQLLGLSPEQLLLHLCAHASYQHGFEFGIRSLVDVAATLRRFDAELDWELVVRQCRAWRWQRGVGVSLSLARELFGADVPGDALDSFAADTGGAATDTEVINAARVQILGEPSLYAESHHFARLRTTPGFWPKAGQTWGRIFLPRSEMSRLHGKNLGLGRLAMLYVVRSCTLIGRYARSAIGLLEGGTAPLGPAERRQQLRRWLSEG
ncbi:MAG: nucleotidyltransferase family protein [Acidobacteria bacterium]|nr:nucleotidyltransferase family protein [Acidobacteriota bacterium]